MAITSDSTRRIEPWPGKPYLPHLLTPYTFVPVIYLSFSVTPCTFIHSCFWKCCAFCLGGLPHVLYLMNSIQLCRPRSMSPPLRSLFWYHMQRHTDLLFLWCSLALCIYCYYNSCTTLCFNYLSPPHRLWPAVEQPLAQYLGRIKQLLSAKWINETQKN